MLLSQGDTVAEVIEEIGVSEVAYYRWRKEYGGMINQAKRLKDLEKENIFYLFRRDEAGVLGLIGVLAAFGGNLLFLVSTIVSLYRVLIQGVTSSFFMQWSVPWMGEVFIVGLIFVAIAALQARTFPQWVPNLVFLAVVASYVTAVFALSFAMYTVTNLAFELAFVALGYGMWSRMSTSPAS